MSVIPATHTMAQDTPLSARMASRLAGVPSGLFGSERDGAPTGVGALFRVSPVGRVSRCGQPCPAHSQPPPPATQATCKRPSPLYLPLQEKHVDIAHPSCHETCTDRGKRTKVGLWGPGAPRNLHFVPVARAWGYGCLLGPWLGTQPMERSEEGAWALLEPRCLGESAGFAAILSAFLSPPPDGSSCRQACRTPPKPSIPRGLPRRRLPPLSSEAVVCEPTLPQLQNLQSGGWKSGDTRERPHGHSGPLGLNTKENQGGRRQEVGGARLRKADTTSGLLQV